MSAMSLGTWRKTHEVPVKGFWAGQWFVCPKCGTERKRSLDCPHCGTAMVVQGVSEFGDLMALEARKEVVNG